MVSLSWADHLRIWLLKFVSLPACCGSNSPFWWVDIPFCLASPSYFLCIPMYFLWLKSCYPWTSHFSRSNSSPPGLGAEFQGGRRQSQLLLVSRLSYLGSLCGASDHCGYQVRSSEGSGRCNLMVSEVTIITIYMDGHFTSLVDFLLIDGIY